MEVLERRSKEVGGKEVEKDGERGNRGRIEETTRVEVLRSSSRKTREDGDSISVKLCPPRRRGVQGSIWGLFFSSPLAGARGFMVEEGLTIHRARTRQKN